MLTPEQIKKLIEIANPESFSYHESPSGNSKFDNLKAGTEYYYFDSSILMDLAYPLFLQRCIEGINNAYSVLGTSDYWIEQDYSEIKVVNYRYEDKYANIEIGDGIIEAKEKALRYILNES